MIKVLAFDVGRRLGYAALAGVNASAGSRLICEKWQPYGANALRAEGVVRETIKEFQPTVLALATQFVSRKYDTPDNLIPMYWLWMEIHKIAHQCGLRMETIAEGEARKTLLGEKIPKGSEAKKQAVWQACLDRGWRCCDWDASDALCVALAVQERLEPSQSHLTTPLFMAAPKRRRRRAA